MDEPLTKSLERYDVLDRIAVGGMAEVFLAKAYGAHGFEKTLAIKRILPELARDPEFEARFIAEAKVAVRLSHANVVQVLDFGRIGESLFIAMEYVDGLDLAAMLRKFKDEKRLVPLPAAFHIAIEIIRALDFAHGHNVVHRDVSPSNVLVSRAGEVKIADFGIAVAAQPHRGGGPGPRKVMGKWRYMSPEQARGDTLDTRSDLFSAASVIYELFTNEKLFPGDEAEEIIKNINEMPIPKMGAMRNGIPSRLDEVLNMALARKPIDRPTRPATVLRSLIELSYESSIMATALDVAEALATVIPAKRPDGGRGALDDVIRKQLHEQSVARRTAVTDGKPPSTETAGSKHNEVSTGLFRKLDMDGVSRLEEVEATRVAAPRAKRNSSQGDVMPGDTDLHALYESGGGKDPDRFTEVGGPPTGQVPKLGQSGDKLPVLKRRAEVTAKGASGKVPWVAIVLLLLVAGGVVAFALGRGGGKEVVAPPEAGVPEAKLAKLTIDPEPEGASGYIELASNPKDRQVIPKLTHERPFTAEVRPNEKYRIHLEIEGYTPKDDTLELRPGQDLSYKTTLSRAFAKLDVATVPDGVQVVLGGRVLGDAPKLFENLQPAKDIQVTLQKPDFTPITKTITLTAGETTTVKETLVAIEKFGTISVKVTGAVITGTVYFNGKPLGINATLSEERRFRVPVGPGTILVKNGDKQATLRITVTEGHRLYTVKL